MKSRLMRLSDKVTLGSIEYKINTDFNVWIEVESLLFDMELDPTVRLAKVLALAYPVLPQNPYDALQGVLDFYMGEDSMQLGEGEPTHNVALPCYDLNQDFDYIWGGFMMQYGIDLTQSHMHWWKFRALLACLSDECKFSKIVAFRTMDTSSIRDKNIRQYYEKMKRKFRLKGRQGTATGEDMVASSLEGLF